MKYFSTIYKLRVPIIFLSYLFCIGAMTLFAALTHIRAQILRRPIEISSWAIHKRYFVAYEVAYSDPRKKTCENL